MADEMAVRFRLWTPFKFLVYIFVCMGGVFKTNLQYGNLPTFSYTSLRELFITMMYKAQLSKNRTFVVKVNPRDSAINILTTASHFPQTFHIRN